MKNVIIGILAISTLVLGFLQIKSCSGDKSLNGIVSKPEPNATPSERSEQNEKFIIDFSELPKDFSDESDAKIVDLNTAKAIISYNIPKDPLRPTYRDSTYTSSAFFNIADILLLIKNYYQNPPPNAQQLLQLGFRIYFGKYDTSNQYVRNHLGDLQTYYSDRPTAVLQLMDNTNTTFQPRSDDSNQFVTLNLGQLCPPRCPNSYPRKHDIFWVPIFQ